MKLLNRLKLYLKHRGQPAIQREEGDFKESSVNRYKYENAYDCVEIVRRGVDLIVDLSSEINTDIKGRLGVVIPRSQFDKKRSFIRQRVLDKIINFIPNDFENIDEFRRQLVTDLLLTGNAYQYFDGVNLFQLPSKLMKIETGTQNKVLKYVYDSKTEFSVSEIIHTKDNSGRSVYVGTSRLRSAETSIRVLSKMLVFQENFFDNGAVPGLVLTTPNVLSRRIKEQMLQDWLFKYRPTGGGKRPIILDGDLKINPISNQTFKEMDFTSSVTLHEAKILKALGVPPILIESGNNANIRPNLQLFYETTVLPVVAKFIASYEAFFGYDLEPDTINVRALQPELREASAFFTALVNSGIMTVNEARAKLRLEKSSEEQADELRIPRNITGSAIDPNEGGRPTDSDSEESNETQDDGESSQASDSD